MDPMIGGALIGAGTDLVSGLLNNSSSAKAASRAGKYAIKLWKMQADYNTPANQVARLRAAGLNPNLIYGGGDANTGNMAHAPAMTEPAEKNWDFLRTMNTLTAAAQLKNINQQNKNLKAQTDSIRADTSLKSKNVELKEKELQLKERELGILERTGMRPGIGSAIVGFGDAVAKGLTGNNASPVERFENVGKSVRNSINLGLPSFNLGMIDPFRAEHFAEKAATKKFGPVKKGPGSMYLNKERDAYKKKVIEVYKRTH